MKTFAKWKVDQTGLLSAFEHLQEPKMARRWFYDEGALDVFWAGIVSPEETEGIEKLPMADLESALLWAKARLAQEIEEFRIATKNETVINPFTKMKVSLDTGWELRKYWESIGVENSSAKKLASEIGAELKMISNDACVLEAMLSNLEGLMLWEKSIKGMSEDEVLESWQETMWS